MKHRDKIIDLLRSGASYGTIKQTLGCSKGTIAFHARRLGLNKGFQPQPWQECARCKKSFKAAKRGTGIIHCSRSCREKSQIVSFKAECICLRCKRLYTRIRGQHSTLTYCGYCVIYLFRQRRKQKAVDYKGGKCIDCGYNRCLRALSFHHTNGDKEFSISETLLTSWSRLVKELDKCVLLCMNCHAERHADEIAATVA